MGRRTRLSEPLTLPPSPSLSSSSSDFEFTISLSPSSRRSPHLCPADELFYKGQLLPLHISPRLSMVRTLLLASSSSSSIDTTTTASRDSNGSSTDSSYGSDLALLTECDSSRPSSVTEDDELKKQQTKKSRSFSSSLAKFSSVFRRDSKNVLLPSLPSSSKRISPSAAKEVIRKYMKRVKPLYEKFLTKQQQRQEQQEPKSVTSYFPIRTERSGAETNNFARSEAKENKGCYSHSFSGNLRYPRRRNCVSSCPSSMRSSPSHSGVLRSHGCSGNYSDTSSMEELQNAIQGAIAHCKGSMIQSNLKKGADG